MNTDNLIQINNVSKSYPHESGVASGALEHVSLDVKRGEFFCLLGPSGCGKSTLLNLMAGFEQPTSGSISIDGVPVCLPQAEYISVFQNYGLFPWRNVIDNVCFGLEIAGLSVQEQKERAQEYIDLVGLGGSEKKSMSELSGGMQQRVAIARALATKPKVLFMDEPFGALDEMTRLKLGRELLRIWEHEKVTIVFVTHNIDDAIALGDRIGVMGEAPGRIKEIIPVTLSRQRDTTTPEASALRKKILGLFGV